ncbi:MAG: SAP domain-containing protein [Propionibacteriales bacterium]|nr:SAP domain-containing protein [Propionibacteriales bacterium]
MSIQDQYTSQVRQATETWAGVAESASDNLQRAFGQSTSAFDIIDPNAAIDQVFDFWEKTLEVQRGIAKQLIGATVEVGERVRAQAESVGQAVRDQGESAKRTVQERAEAAQEAAREQAAEKYEELTKAELQDELASRDLPKTGNVDELRERLIADDQS